MQTKISRESTVDRISDRIESLHEAFRTLPKAATLKELSDGFAGIVRDLFPGTEVDLVFRPDPGGGWQPLTAQMRQGVDQLLSLPAGRAPFWCSFDEQSPQIRLVQRLDDKSFIGLLLAVQLPDSRAFDADVVPLRLLMLLFANAYREMLSRRTEKDLIFSLNHRLLQLNSLIDTGIEVAKLDQDSSPHRLALERAASLTNASQGVVRVTAGAQLKEETFFPAGIPAQSALGASYRIASSFTFGGDTFAFELYEKESRSGVLPFEETDQLLLDALARQVHASLENRYLLRQALEKEKIEHDLALAASIQQRLLPKSLPAIDGYDIAGINIPTKSVGGDYYDCIPLPDGKYALVIADVAGKGMPAALLVSSLHAYLAAYLETPMPLAQLAGRLNKAIGVASTEDRFITAFIALLSPLTGEIESVNAGHNPVFVLRNDNSLLQLSEGGIALGMLDIDFPYQTEHLTLEKGERLLLYTDGITEATNDRDQLYDSATPLDRFMMAHKPGRADAFIQDLIGDIRRFTGSAPQSDDITALYLLRR